MSDDLRITSEQVRAVCRLANDRLAQRTPTALTSWLDRLADQLDADADQMRADAALIARQSSLLAEKDATIHRLEQQVETLQASHAHLCASGYSTSNVEANTRIKALEAERDRLKEAVSGWLDAYSTLQDLLRRIARDADYADENYQRVPVALIEEIDALAGTAPKEQP